MRTQSGLWTGMAMMAVVLVGTACGSSEDPVGGPQYTYPDVPSYCMARAKAECSAEVLDGCQTAETTCIATRSGSCGQNAPGVKYRPAEADKCVAAVGTAYVDDKFTGAELKYIEEECAKLFGGLGGKGSSCSSDADCNLDASLSCVKGTCQEPVEVEAGGECDAPDAVCVDGYFCASGALMVCAKKRLSGQPCNAGLICADDLRCVQTDPEADGVCQAKLAIQSDCHCPIDSVTNEEEEWCGSSECADGLCLKIGDAMKCGSSTKFSANEPICSDFR